MSKRLTYWICGILLGISGCVLIRQQMNRPDNPTTQPATPSVAPFIIPESELPSLQSKARNGDCEAAHRLGMYHFFATLNYIEATTWFRTAAKCPNVHYMASLVAALLAQKNDPVVDAEIDRVLGEMQKIGPDDVDTKRAEEEVRLRRQAVKMAK